MKVIAISAVFSLVFASANGQFHKQYPLFIYSFTRYVQWPEAYNKGDFEILVLGDTPVIEALNDLAKSKKAGDRTIKVIKITDVGQIRKCNILFIPVGNLDKFEEIESKVENLSVLVVTEEKGLGTKGSSVNFIEKDGKLAFEMNQSALNKHKLKAANELLRLAIII